MRLSFVVAMLASAAVLVSPAASSRERASATVPQFVRVLAFDPSNSNVVWAALQDSSLYRSTDGAQTWRRIELLPRRQSIGTIALDRSGQQVYVGSK